jgi:curved DNA-binding protein CbpA
VPQGNPVAKNELHTACGDEELMKALNEAREILLSARLRAAYDWLEAERRVPTGNLG